MKLPSRQRQYGLRVNLMPLNDIVFLLIIFLVAAPHFKPTDRVEDIELSKVEINRGAESVAERRMEVTVTRDGQIKLLGKPLTLPQLDAELKNFGSRYQMSPERFELRIRSDRRVKFRVLRPILLRSVRAGITNIKLAVLPEKS